VVSLFDAPPAERPANIVFIFGNVVRETLALKP
jgi:hypothetical protein